MRRILGTVLVAASAAAALVAPVGSRAVEGPAACGPATGPVTFSGAVTRADAKTYKVLPFAVQPGTTRVEVSYSWGDVHVTPMPPPSTPATQTVFDIGLWDQDGYRSPAGFRGWSGSRQGRTGSGTGPVWVQADAAERGYLPGAVQPGTWWVDLGIAAVGPTGAQWFVRVRCLDPPVGPEPQADPVDPTHVAGAEAGWYFGDFHMHAYHSANNGPTWEQLVQQSRDAGLDFLPVTEYVTSAHWSTLGALQRANPDLVIWPGREIITYFGHANALGETPSVVDWRHGFEDVTLRQIQAATKADGALFQVNHPTFFPGPLFANFCRGCEFELRNDIDWSAVDTIEVLTGPVAANTADLGAPTSPANGQQPFTLTAIELWEDLLNEGHKITAVSGSDSKGNEPSAAERTRRGYGSSATAVYAARLSRPALMDGLRAGRAYIAARGVHGSPTLRMTAVAPGGQTGSFGDTLAATTADVTVTVAGGAGQMLRIIRDGQPVATVPVASNAFSFTFPAAYTPGSGPLGTFWRVETFDATSLTTIGNPVFLKP